MKYLFTGRPKPVARSVYEAAISRMCEGLRGQSGIRAIYQIGGVSTPGISDIDMVAVFEDGVGSRWNPRHSLSPEERYLFTHELYGASVTDFVDAQRYSLFHNYRLLHGEDIRSGAEQPDEAELALLKAQIALEFLVKMYVNMVVQRAYRVFKLRSFFLHSKAIAYDLDFLGITAGRLHELTHQLIDVRNNWFSKPVADDVLSRLADAFFRELVIELGRALDEHSFWLPGPGPFSIAPGRTIRQGSRLQADVRGIVLPRLLARLGPKYFNLQQRFNSFVFEIPFLTMDLPPVLSGRAALVERMRDRKAAELPCYAVLTSSLNA